MRKFHVPFFLLVVASHISVCLHAQAFSAHQTFYASTTGNDNNPGTKEQPLQTIGKINLLHLHPGDSLCFKGGETFAGTLQLRLQGTAEQRIVVTSYGKGRATINGRTKEAALLEGTHFVFQNINAKGLGRKTGNRTNGISISNSENIFVRSVQATGFQKSGLQVFNSKNVSVKEVTAAHNGFCGIFITGTSQDSSKNIRIQDCAAINNPGDPTNSTNHSGNGILVGFSDSVLIAYCTATGNGWDMPRKGNGPVGIWAYESSHVTIQYCISYGNKTAAGAADGGGFDLDGGVTHSIIQYCLSYENEGSGYGLFQYSGASTWQNNQVRYCISINDGKKTGDAAGILVWNDSGDSNQFAGCNVYNNVVYNDKVPAVNFLPQSINSDFGFYNNIFMGAGEIIGGPQSGEQFLGNVWWQAASKKITFRGHATLKAWATATGQEQMNGVQKGMQVNPLLVGPFTTTLTNPHRLSTLTGYKLKQASPVKNKGLNLQMVFPIAYPPHDFFGNPVSTGRTPGVFEIKD